MTVCGNSLVLSGGGSSPFRLCAFDVASGEVCGRVLASWPKREKVLVVNGVNLAYFGRTNGGKVIAWSERHPEVDESFFDGISFTYEMEANYYYGDGVGGNPWRSRSDYRYDHGGSVVGDFIPTAHTDGRQNGVLAEIAIVRISAHFRYDELSIYGTPYSGVTRKQLSVMAEWREDGGMFPSNAFAEYGNSERDVMDSSGRPFYHMKETSVVSGVDCEIKNYEED